MRTNTTSPNNYSQLKAFARENRKEQTEAEKKLWENIRRKYLGVHFKRQYIISDFIVDFVCVEKKLVIEVDGGYHQELFQSEHDEGRTVELNKLGYTVIRFTNEEVMDNIESVIEKIKENI